MAAPTLQQAIDKAGSAVRVLWKPGAAAWKVPVIEPEYVGWRAEQAASSRSVALSDLSHHMSDLFIEGPDATRLLSDFSANDYQSFAIGQAKQFIPVTAQGDLVVDGILLRTDTEKYILSGVPAAQSWIAYHGKKSGYDVSFKLDPDSEFRRGGNPVLFRYQVQGPRALELVERLFGGPIPKTKFFHATPVTLDRRSFRALRHGMAGQAGYEFIGDWNDAAYVKDRLMSVGEAFGIVHVGGLAYSTNGIESGWIPTPTPGIYTSPELQEYRESLSVFSYEGQKPLHGSFFSDNIEDYYCSPFELGYGKSIAFNHDFLGRAALEQAKDRATREKVTLVLNVGDVRKVLGADPGFILSYGRYRIEVGSRLIGLTFYTAWIDPAGTMLSLALVDKSHAAPGTEVAVVWGEHPGYGTDPEADLGFPRIRATVQVAPYNEYARTKYRTNG